MAARRSAMVSSVRSWSGLLAPVIPIIAVVPGSWLRLGQRTGERRELLDAQALRPRARVDPGRRAGGLHLLGGQAESLERVAQRLAPLGERGIHHAGHGMVADAL